MNLKQIIQSGKKPSRRGKVFFAVLPLVLICSVLMLTSAVERPATASLFEKKEKPQKIFAALSGFEPGAAVTYSILSGDDNVMQVTSVVDRHGYLNIPMPKNFEATDTDVIYDFSISEQNRTLSLLLRVDSDTGAVSVKSQGSDPFADIEIQASGSNIQTRTDWAGLFEETGIRGKAQDQGPKPVQVAFYSRDIASDARNHQSPAVIKVLTAPGGGSLGGGGVNTFTETNCAPYPLSTCNTASVNNQNNQVVANYVIALQLFTEQMSAVALQQVSMIGMFFDAKLQLETQRAHQKLKAAAIKDYHPSDQMCRIGSYARSLANAEEKVAHDHIVLNDILMETEANRYNMGTALGPESDARNRIAQFKEIYCDTSDNNAGLDLLCARPGGAAAGAVTQTRVNKDIDYARTIELPYTLDVDFTSDVLSDEETDVVALARNLYWTDAFSFVAEDKFEPNSRYFQRSRQHMALNNLAHNSYTKLVAMKSRAPDPPAGVEPGWAYMKTMLRELGMSDPDIEDMIGENPSYHAQMDILGKKIFQSPDFYTNLYDKPVNVDRINASLEAIGLMQQRDHYEAALRREMLMSGMVEQELITDAEKLQGEMLELE